MQVSRNNSEGMRERREDGCTTKALSGCSFGGDSLDVLPPSGSLCTSLTRTASFSHWAGGSADGSQGLRWRRGSWLDGSCPGAGFRLRARRWPGPGAAGGCRPAAMGKARERGGFFFKATFKGFICKSFHVPEQRLWGNSHWVRVAAKLDGKPRFMPYFSLLNPSFAGLKSQQPSAHSWASPRQR